MSAKKLFSILGLVIGSLQLGGVQCSGAAAEAFSTDFEPPTPDKLYTAQWINYPWDKEFNQGKNTGFFRQTITLPKEPIFSAIVEVPAYSCHLYVNGQLAAGVATTVCGPYWTYGVEITKYLKPGVNVLGLQVFGNGYAFLQGDIVFVSGKVIHLASDHTWKYSKEAPANWSTTGADDSNWQAVKTQGACTSYSRGRVPAYSGRLMLENTDGKKLFYSDTNEVVFRVRIPAGLAAQSPVVKYVIHNVTNGLAEGQGDVTQFEQQKDSLVYRIAGGKLPRGVHVISLELLAGTETLEKRENEVFIVCGRIPQAEVAGDSLEEGMELQLEDMIKCYDAQDPHEFLEGGNGPSQIVSRNGLKYRELGASRGKWISKPGGGFGEKGWENSPGSFIAYKIKYKEADQPYLIVLEYPDNRERSIQFQVNEIPVNPEKAEKNVWVYQKEGAGAVCGGIFPLSCQIRKLPVLLFPSRSEGIVTVNTAMDGKPAAASRILVYRVGQIPAMRLNYSGERWLGRYSERGYSFRRMLDGYRVEPNFAPVHQPLEEKQSNWHTGYWSPATFAMWFRTIERFVQYLRFCGENMYIAGCYQYDENNTPYSLPLLKGGRTARIEPDYRELMAAIFQENDLALWAGLEIVTHQSIKEAACAKRSDEEVGQGAETLWQVTAKGKQIKHGSAWSDLGNLYHPKVQTALGVIVEDLCEKLAPFTSFKGFYSVDWPGWGWAPNNLGGYEDYTFNLFEKETKASIPVQANNPGRFEQRASWLKEHPETAEKYARWRCQKMKEVKAQLVKKIQTYRDDLGFIFRCGDRTAWKDGAEDFNTFMKKTYVQDLDLYREEKSLTLARMCIRGDESGKINAYTNFVWRVAVSPLGHFDENPITNPKYTEQWPWYHILAGGCPTPAGVHTGEEFARIMGEWDPEVVVFAWLDEQIFLGHEQEIRNFARGFLALPGVNLERVQGPGIDPNVIVRSGRAGEQTVIFLANPGWWQNQVELELELGGAGRVWDLTTGEEIEADYKGQKVQLKITLPPYGTRSLGVSGLTAVKGVFLRHFKPIASIKNSRSV